MFIYFVSCSYFLESLCQIREFPDEVFRIFTSILDFSTTLESPEKTGYLKTTNVWLCLGWSWLKHTVLGRVLQHNRTNRMFIIIEGVYSSRLSAHGCLYAEKEENLIEAQPMNLNASAAPIQQWRPGRLQKSCCFSAHRGRSKKLESDISRKWLQQ